MRKLRIYLTGTIAVVVLALGATLLAGNEPVLGLDLQGGVSVVLQPVGHNVRSSSIDQAVDIIRNRVDSLGVAEPDISRQGDNIVVDLPGVKDRAKAQRIVGRTAELRFRPVLAALPPEAKKPKSSSSTTTTTTPGSSTTAPASTTTTTTAPANDAAAKAAIASCEVNQLATLSTIPTTRLADDKRDACVVLPFHAGQGTGRLFLGPTKLTGNDVDSASSSFASGTGYVVDMNLKSEGLTKFNDLASKSFGKASPQDQVAIVLDGEVYSNPAFQSATFSGPVQISGSFSSTDASDLAKLINYGALPVQLKQLTSENVSPSLGSDQLDAGIAAGVIGLALVAIYMLVYYRLLGGVVILGLLVSAALTYSLISYLGQSVGLTLTLAGVTGLIVSVGITVDSYVVYFERLKDEVRTGRTVRSSVDRGFARSFRTIVAADLVSLIGAGALYFLAIGSVRGFAFYLGISTILDLLVSYFFMHPLVSIMARRPHLVRMRGVGIAAGLDVDVATAIGVTGRATREAPARSSGRGREPVKGGRR
ncbi:MAG TPA: protein translocase subunit SecD [Acidimicrobiia bacterium]|nr:protein translocase subunit SecD [Acidimicrobiia bacterium]